VSSIAAGSIATGKPPSLSSPPRGHSFRLGVEHDGATLYLRLTGALKWPCVGRVEAALERVSELSTRRVVFDLRGLSALDMAGLRTLLRANERARTELFDVIVVRPKGMVKRIFTLTRAGEELRMVDSVPGKAGPGTIG